MIADELKYRIRAAFGYEPTREQEEAIDVFATFMADSRMMPVMVMRGSAGTGKTTLAAAIVRALQSLEQQLVLLAPTGRAAKVFSLYAGSAAYTIHRRIYRQKSLEGGFELGYNNAKDTLFIVDEASMISLNGDGRSLLDDLISFVYNGRNCRLMLIGDHAQLPPVGEEESPALMAPVLSSFGLHVYECTLNEVLRQSQESGILWNATAVRRLMYDGRCELPKIQLDGFTDIKVVPGDELIETLASSYSKVGLDETMVVTRSNKRANIFNQGIRNQILGREEELTTGDQLMVVKNNYYWVESVIGASSDPQPPNLGGLTFIANGDMAVVRRVRNVHEQHGFRFAEVTMTFPDYDNYELTATVLLDTLTSEAPALTHDQQEELYNKVMEDYADIPRKADRMKALKEDRYYNALQVKFAYAATCHKAQGGQWAHIYVDQGYMTDDMLSTDYLHWLYTAFTRATEQLYYADGLDGECYNGNISTMKWKMGSDNSFQGYNLKYDGNNRLTSAVFGTGNNLTGNKDYFSESADYDCNGNITSLRRSGLVNKIYGGFGLVDNLNMTYEGNMLTSVRDNASHQSYAGATDFDGVAGQEYPLTYNGMGSLASDAGRKIAKIDYDYRNNPVRIQFTNGNVTKYVYSATGEKLRVIYQTAVPNITVAIGNSRELARSEIQYTDSTDYLLGGSLTLKNGRIDKYQFDEGYCQAEKNSNNTSQDDFTFCYYDRDHLGNIRQVTKASGKGTVIQTMNYYPFGAQFCDGSASNSDVQSHKYNGKEFDKMHGLNTYDYGARQYNPVTGRWDRVDQLTEKSPNMTPFHFCHDNPMNRIDPDGRDDYFNSSGAFMYSTSSGSNVYVNNVMITNIPLNSQSSRQAVANVMGYYAKEAGVSFYTKGGHPVGDSPSGIVGLADLRNDSDKKPACTHGDDIFINKSGNKIGAAMHDKYNIMSTLEHEKYHKEAKHGWNVSPSASAHAGVYAKQISSKTFLKTTENFQKGIIASFINYLNKAIKEDGVSDNRINSLLDDANKTLQKAGHQIIYERDGGESSQIYFK